MNKGASKSGHGRACCVPNCPNTERKNTELTFYSFPNRAWETDRKKLWIARVRRAPFRGQAWLPNSETRICSAHFIGGEKSQDPRKESYNPTIFPWKPLNKASLTRAARLESRRNRSQIENNDNEEMKDHLYKNASDEEPKCREVAIQTDYIDSYCTGQEEIVLQSWHNELTNDASTQAVIPINNSQRKKVKIVEIEVLQTKRMKHVRVGTDIDMRSGFQGFADIRSDEQIKHMGGITLNIFNKLLTFVNPGAVGKPRFYKVLNSQDRLLLFLMKMKLGLPFTAIACMFGIGKQTARDIFAEVLETIYIATRTWIFWPSKGVVQETMPASFKAYPNCRAIIDCTELRCETPPTVEQRALFYSSYKSTYTVKFLIAITPSGFISFISKGYGGRSSDSQIVNDSGFVKLVEPGDEIMADKGFPQIRSELIKKKCTLVIPPFDINPQFTREEVLQGYSIASVRIHMERSIQRVRLFKILDHVTIKLLPFFDKIMYVACILANNKEPLIR